MMKMLHLDAYTGLVAGHIVLLESGLCSLRDNSSVTCNTASIKTTSPCTGMLGGWLTPSVV